MFSYILYTILIKSCNFVICTINYTTLNKVKEKKYTIELILRKYSLTFLLF